MAPVATTARQCALRDRRVHRDRRRARSIVGPFVADWRAFHARSPDAVCTIPSHTRAFRKPVLLLFTCKSPMALESLKSDHQCPYMPDVPYRRAEPYSSIIEVAIPKAQNAFCFGVLIFKFFFFKKQTQMWRNCGEEGECRVWHIPGIRGLVVPFDTSQRHSAPVDEKQKITYGFDPA